MRCHPPERPLRNICGWRGAPEFQEVHSEKKGQLRVRGHRRSEGARVTWCYANPRSVGVAKPRGTTMKLRRQWSESQIGGDRSVTYRLTFGERGTVLDGEQFILSKYCKMG
uniref:DUF2147 domain-containing protein n=1 Tax=Steinernema glaseri TaxID=37863 RepID=A0A1I7YN20_9BILA